MSYTPTVWETDDPITAANLNKMEQGIAAANSNVAYVIIKTPIWTSQRPSIYVYYSKGNIIPNDPGSISLDWQYLDHYWGNVEYNYFIVPIFNLDEDGIQTVVCFDETWYTNNTNIVVSGNLSGPVYGREHTIGGSWSSSAYISYIVRGSGTIEITAK